MNVLAFMQEPAIAPIDAKDVFCYRDNQVFHKQRLLRSMSGRRLLSAFGNKAFDQVYWDNTNWRPRWMTKNVTMPDFDHMIGSIKNHQPKLILYVGKVAREALEHLTPHISGIPIRGMPHPNAMGITMDELKSKAQAIMSEFPELFHETHT